MTLDEDLQMEIANNDGDISKVYVKLQEEFFLKYNQSNQFHHQEKAQRKLLAFYQRRNNAILDILAEFSQGSDGTDLGLRIDNLLTLVENPNVKKTLSKLKVGEFSQDEAKLHKLNLLLLESISELEIDDLINLEKNPQDIEFWLRRSHPNLVLSRFRPIEFVDGKLFKQDSNLDNSNNSLNNHMNMKRKKKNH